MIFVILLLTVAILTLLYTLVIIFRFLQKRRRGENIVRSLKKNGHVNLNQVKDWHPADVVTALSENKRIFSLNLSRTRTGADVEAVVSILFQNKSLQSVDLGNNGLTSEGVKKMFLALKDNQSLISLSLSYNDINDDYMREISEALKINRHLRYLSLCHNNITDVGAEILLSSLKENSSLLSLNLRLNRIGSKMSRLFEDLNGNKTLRSIDVGMNSFSGRGRYSISSDQNLTSDDRNSSSIHIATSKFLLTDVESSFLQVVNFSGYYDYENTTNHHDTANLVDNLAILLDQSRIQSMNLSKNNIDHHHGIKLMAHLKKNKFLKHLNLSENRFKNNKAINSLVEVLNENKTLQGLHLGWNGIEREGALRISQGLKNNNHLTFMDLGNNQIGDFGAVKIIDSLQENFSLKILKLSRNKLGDATMRALGNLLKTNPSLRGIDLSWNEINFSGIEIFTSIIQLEKAQPKTTKVSKNGNNDHHKVSNSNDNLNKDFNHHNNSKSNVDIVNDNNNDNNNNNNNNNINLFTCNNIIYECHNNYNNKISNSINISHSNNNCECYNNSNINDPTFNAKLLKPKCSKPNIQSNHLNMRSSQPLKLNSLSIKEKAYDTQLQYLDLCRNNIADEGVKKLLCLFDNDHSLQCLNLSLNNIGPKGINAIVAFLRDNRTLHSLDLSCNRMGEEDEKRIATALKSNQKITYLHTGKKNDIIELHLQKNLNRVVETFFKPMYNLDDAFFLETCDQHLLVSTLFSKSYNPFKHKQRRNVEEVQVFEKIEKIVFEGVSRSTKIVIEKILCPSLPLLQFGLHRRIAEKLALKDLQRYFDDGRTQLLFKDIIVYKK
eukprot:Awhi_evm2s14966